MLYLFIYTPKQHSEFRALFNTSCASVISKVGAGCGEILYKNNKNTLKVSSVTVF